MEKVTERDVLDELERGIRRRLREKLGSISRECRDLAQDLVRLAERVEGVGRDEEHTFVINSCGAVQGRGPGLDSCMRATMELRDVLADLVQSRRLMEKLGK